MQDRHGRDLTSSVVLGPACQTSWVMENLRDKFTPFQTQTFLRLILPSTLSLSASGPRAKEPVPYRKKKALQLHIALQAKQDRQALSCRIRIEASFHRYFPVGFLHYKCSLSCREICVAELTTNV